jgi:hypothetical protein
MKQEITFGHLVVGMDLKQLFQYQLNDKQNNYMYIY